MKEREHQTSMWCPNSSHTAKAAVRYRCAPALGYAAVNEITTEALRLPNKGNKEFLFCFVGGYKLSVYILGFPFYPFYIATVFAVVFFGTISFHDFTHHGMGLTHVFAEPSKMCRLV